MGRAVCDTHIGRRLNHEDNFLFDGTHLTSDMQKQMPQCRSLHLAQADSEGYQNRLYAISDGMGGHNAGEAASRICVERLAKTETALQHCTCVKEAVATLQESIADINRVVCERSRQKDGQQGMGATLVLCAACGGEHVVLNIGDSRAYLFCGNAITQITKDHTEGQRMLDLGLLTRKELRGFPARKNLNRYIGYGQQGYVLQADVYGSIPKTGWLLLCSDGIPNALQERQILQILQTAGGMESAGKQLVEEAAAVPNADNATAILIPLKR